jgi:acyl-CoA thioesterase
MLTAARLIALHRGRHRLSLALTVVTNADMSTLEQTTAVLPIGDGRYRGDISEEWKMWVPVGGYLASIALRAAGAHSSLARPASLSCHYLAEAKFGPVDIDVTTLRTIDGAESLEVTLSQDGIAILEALVWAAAADLEGPRGAWLPAPEAPPPDGLEVLELDEDSTDRFGDEPFWRNLDIRPIRLGHGPPPAQEEDPSAKGGLVLVAKRASRLRGWDRFVPEATYDDPWVDACRSLIVIDISQFPAVAMPYTPPIPFLAPTLDLTVAFHDFAPDEEWLMADALGTHAGDGLLAATSHIWARSGKLLATGSSHMIFRTVAPVPADSDRAWFETVDA